MAIHKEQRGSLSPSTRRPALPAGPARDETAIMPVGVAHAAHIVYLTNGGDLIIARRGAAAFGVERRYKVADSQTWAMPVLIGSDILVRDATGLVRLTPGP